MPVVPFTAIYPDGPATAAAAGDTSAAAAGSGAFNPGPYPELPLGALPFDRDIQVAAAGTTLVLDPGAGYKFYIVSALLSTDTAMQIKLIDQNDVQGQRALNAFFAANGGATP